MSKKNFLSRHLFNSSVTNYAGAVNSIENAFLDLLTPVIVPELTATFSYPKFNSFRRQNGELVIDLAVPYVTQNDIELETDDAKNVINVTVKAHQEQEVGDDAYLVRQIPRSGFKQIFEVHELNTVKGLKADLANGVLRLTLPYIKATLPKIETRKIKIG